MYKMMMFVLLALVVVAVIFFTTDSKTEKILLGGVNQKESAPIASDWKEFTARSGNFKALLPSDPQYARQGVEIPNSDKKRRYDLYASEKVNGTVFMISISTYPPEIDTSDVPQMLQGALTELMQGNPDNKLLKQEDTIYQNQPALEFTIENDPFKVEGIAFMVGKALYVLSYTARTTDFNPAEYKHFIDSFVLLSKKDAVK